MDLFSAGNENRTDRNRVSSLPGAVSSSHPAGDTVTEEGDTLLILTSSETAGPVREIIIGETKEEPDDVHLEKTGFPIDILMRYH